MQAALTWVGGGAAVFYALGYTIVRSYFNDIGIAGAFWLTEKHFIDAGATFLIEMVKALLIAPYLLGYLILLLFLLPTKKGILEIVTKFGEKESDENESNIPTMRKTLALLAIMIGTGLFTLTFDSFLEKYSYIVGWASALNFAAKITDVLDSSSIYSSIYFVFLLPVLVVNGAFLYRFSGWAGSNSKSKRRSYFAFAALYFTFICSVPFSYGMHIYDLKVITLKKSPFVDVEKTAPDPGLSEDGNSRDETTYGFIEPDSAPSMWLIGFMGDKYIFFVRNNENRQTAITVVEPDNVSRLDLHVYDTKSLRALSSEDVGSISVSLVDDDDEIRSLLGLMPQEEE